MKKSYLTPTIKTIRVQLTGLLADSIQTLSAGTDPTELRPTPQIFEDTRIDGIFGD